MKIDAKERYTRNHNSITLDDQEKLAAARVCVIGCGGLGGYVIEELARVGVGHIIGVDGDVFDVSNLNRQLLSQEALLGKAKAEVAADRVAAINSDVEFTAINGLFTQENGAEIVDGCDLVVDALDKISVRLVMEDICREEGVPIVHGAIGGWCGQVATVFPGDNLLHRLYEASEEDRGAELELGNPAFTPAVTASIQVAEAVKVLTGRVEDTLRNRLLIIDMESNYYEVMEM